MASLPDKTKKFTSKMRKKLLVLFSIMLVAFAALSLRLFIIARDNGEDYARQVLSQQEYDSITIPYRRGDIYDQNGMILAASNKVYNVILDCSLLMLDEDYLEPTLNALHRAFNIDINSTRQYITANPNSKYKILARRVEYEDVAAFEELKKEEETGQLIKGIWFEDEYVRQYPNGSLGCDIIGFTSNDNIGNFGLEQYYNSILSGSNGREYGYLNEDSDLQRSIIPAVDGYSIYTTIDINIQNMVEKWLKDFDDQYRENAHTGNGAENVGCIIMEVDTGNVLAMAQYPVYDLNDPRNIDNLIGGRQVDIKGNKTTGKPIEITNNLGPVTEEKSENDVENAGDGTEEETETEETGEDADTDTPLETAEPLMITEPLYITEESIAQMSDDVLYQNYNALWKNFCINNTYEPGSVAKPFTVAAALDSGSITGNEHYNCEGKLEVGGWPIKCHNVYGDGYLSVAECVERSCNVGLMYISFATGKDTFLKYQHAFGFGLKTNIDLAGESRTASLVYNANSMGQTELATNSFGQGFNVTMIQMITGFCSLINGGNFYEPHMVSKIVTIDGSTIRNIEPRVLRQTVSPSTSSKIVEYCNQVVTGEHGTGKTARPAGYMIGGKTGTAETLPRGNGQYVVSFMGYAPADDPQIAIYVVVDRPNVPIGGQDDAKYATRIVRNILTEVLPYMHIYMTEELSEKEIAELEEKNLADTRAYNEGLGNTAETTGETENVTNDASDDSAAGSENTSDQSDAGNETPAEEEIVNEEPWKDFVIDLSTGYAVDPNTGAYVDPVTGATIGLDANLPETDILDNTAEDSASAVGDSPEGEY